MDFTSKMNYIADSLHGFQIGDWAFFSTCRSANSDAYEFQFFNLKTGQHYITVLSRNLLKNLNYKMIIYNLISNLPGVQKSKNIQKLNEVLGIGDE